jgi:homopolymeric O-antigen transport system ATP-binding protein
VSPAEPAITVDGVSKKYKLFPSKRARIREALDPRRRSFHHEFWALRDISFTVGRGHTVGILGMNGSGKSTLLQIIASVLQPTTGTVRVAGKVAALLELGAGFNPDLTARENVVLHGTIMGLSRAEILDRMSAIEAFADIGEFFGQPMKTHSSGMFMRVAFATALYVDPEVLIIDEALSVGDARFQEKCFRRFRTFQDAGKTILFVTHDRSAIPRHCDLGILLHQGTLVDIGDPADIADMYGELLAVGELSASLTGVTSDPTVPSPAVAPGEPAQATPRSSDSIGMFLSTTPSEDRCPLNPTYNAYERRFGNRGAEIVDYLLVSGGAVNSGNLRSGANIDMYVKIRFNRDINAPIIGAVFSNKEGVVVYGTHSDWLTRPASPAHAGEMRAYRITVELSLSAGDWFLQLAVAESASEICDCRTALAHLYLSDRRQYVGLVNLKTEFKEIDLAPAD